MTSRQDVPDTPGQAAGGHPALGLDDVVHQRTRLGILAILAEATEADFTYLRKVLHLTDGNLGRHLEVLEGAGLITISKGYHGRRPRTWATVTGEGRRALRRELASMRALMQRLDSVTSAQGDGVRQPVEDLDEERTSPVAPPQ
jgi:DNA-binding MarR family transcriptional regulator